ncbi:MAG: TIGR03905 family TSCPD domain-containing protein [Eggerthellaceae bacterium]|jgi:uncharacterized protein (TIGR03905 family)
MYTYRTSNVCSREINIDVKDGKIENVSFVGGCQGNLSAISKLIKGMPVDQVIDTLKGNTCGPRSTSCADQLAQALEAIKEHENAQASQPERATQQA